MMQVKVNELGAAPGQPPGVPAKGKTCPPSTAARPARVLIVCALAVASLSACQRRSEVPAPDNRSVQPDLPASSPMPQPTVPASGASATP
ncbi:hypothetical protein QRD43_18065 [Pelomonas sp. APW6]|uniref:Lipoprotein n=1 Tax=Roseateles subflavus TaxID=3053353 RepID=A0ABT7LNI4_9BURK|nr:hypothetical protein [Pelomonas sp. APW6]MDL5033822.1 hypothetical protein [Pelomonas sp. APW6]